MLHTYVTRFDVTENLEKFWKQQGLQGDPSKTQRFACFQLLAGAVPACQDSTCHDGVTCEPVKVRRGSGARTRTDNEPAQVENLSCLACEKKSLFVYIVAVAISI